MELSEDEFSLIQIAKSLVFSTNEIYKQSEFAFYIWNENKHLINQNK